MDDLIRELKGPVLVLGGRGFIGSRLLAHLRRVRADVLGGVSQGDDQTVIAREKPRTVFNCIAYGTKPGDFTPSLMFSTNFTLTQTILSALDRYAEGFTYVHAGSSSEYGQAVPEAQEGMELRPAMPYGVSKAAASMLVGAYGKTLGRRVANLRLYCVYGPGDHASTLVSTLTREGQLGKLPKFKNSGTVRDFVHVDDACRAFVTTAARLAEKHYGESFNVGGSPTCLNQVAETARRVFGIAEAPDFDNSLPPELWFSGSTKIERELGFKSAIGFEDGFEALAREAKA